MKKTSVFTNIIKYSAIIIGISLVLSGCQGVNTTPIDANSTGFFDHYFVYPFSFLLKGAATILNGNYGWSIMVLTLGLRLCLMPLMLKQMKKSSQTKHKMTAIKPEIDDIQSKYKSKKDKDSQAKMQQEVMQVYKIHNMNPLTSMGCLPLLVQLPILTGLYYAIRRTPEIASQSFLWFNLGHADVVLPFITAGIYLIQARASQIGMDHKQKKQMAVLSYISPIMIFIVSFNFPAALPLYWAVSGSFMIVQTLISKNLYTKEKLA